MANVVEPLFDAFLSLELISSPFHLSECADSVRLRGNLLLQHSQLRLLINELDSLTACSTDESCAELGGIEFVHFLTQIWVPS